MHFKEIDEYNQLCAEIDAKHKEMLSNKVNQAWKEIQDFAEKENRENRERDLGANEAPCTVCGKTEYVLKYRDVSGKISGSISGSFSLFGGSISGYIDGDINTKPVLSCRECENEKLISISEYVSDYDVLEQQMPALFDYVEDHPPKDWLKNKGLEVARGLEEHLFLPADYHDIRDFSDDRLISCGILPKYPHPGYPKKPSLYWLKYIINKFL